LEGYVIEFTPWPSIPRLFRDAIVTEKIDGTNAAIGFVPLADIAPPNNNLTTVVFENEGTLEQRPIAVWAQSRKRIITPADDNFGFARWVHDNATALYATLGEGLHFGEWWGSGIQRGYGLEKGEKRFSLFNAKRWTIDQDLLAKAVPGLGVVPTLFNGSFADLMSGDLINVTQRLESKGSLASPGFMKPEGVVIFHLAARQSFKYTYPFDDDGHKGLQHGGQ
jgi:hypothetical protein